MKMENCFPLAASAGCGRHRRPGKQGASPANLSEYQIKRCCGDLAALPVRTACPQRAPTSARPLRIRETQHYSKKVESSQTLAP
ncbi:MAG: hypothetical protein Q8L92_07715, partial [Rubrivivax sp.]|nr:hypothetical protein [Rubrivivax sp.]